MYFFSHCEIFLIRVCFVFLAFRKIGEKISNILIRNDISEKIILKHCKLTYFLGVVSITMLLLKRYIYN